MSITTKKVQKKSKSDHSVFKKQENSKSSLNKHNSPAQDILTLHQTIGNKAVQRLFKSGAIQAKLTIGQPNDKYEEEADRVADEVMRMPEPKEKNTSQGKTNADRTKSGLSVSKAAVPIQRQEEPEQEELLQTKATPGHTPQVTPNVAAKIQSLKGGGLPLSPNQRSFFESRMGQDFSGVRIHTDSKAADTAQTIQAKAFTLGHDIVFNTGQYSHDNQEGKKLLAHELTHVVQQMQGRVRPTMQAKGASINDDKELEREADVMGAKATDLKRSGPATKGSTQQGPLSLQRKVEAKVTFSTAQATTQAVADVALHKMHRLVNGVDAQFQPAVQDLYDAAVGSRDKKELTALERLTLLDTSLAKLQPAIQVMKAEDPDWLQQYVTQPVSLLRANINYAKAAARVKSSVVVSEGAVLELNEDMEPHAQAKVLRAQIHKLIQTSAILNEQAVRLGHTVIHHEAKALLEGKAHASRFGSLAQIQGLLHLMDGWLILTDEELGHHLEEINGVIPGVATYSHLVKGITEILGGTVVATSSFAWAIAKIGGQPEMAMQALGLARGSALKLANVVAFVEIIWGIATLLDPNASGEKKDEALLSVGMGVGWFAAGGPGSVAVLGAYLQLKLMAHLYWSANLNILGSWMSRVFKNIQDQGQSMATKSDELYRGGELVAHEKDPEQLVALTKVQQNLARSLGRSIDYFISDCQPHSYAAGAAKYPGAYKILREVFAPIMGLKGRDKPEEVATAAALVLEKITWCLQHAGDLLNMAAHKKTVAEWRAERKETGHGEGH